MFRSIACALIGLGCVTSGLAADKLPLALSASAGSRERVDALVQFPLSKELAAAGPLRLMETTGGNETPIAAQVDPLGNRLWWVAGGVLAAGAKRTYRLEAGESPAAPGIAVAESERAVAASCDSRPLLQYAKAHVEPASGINPRYGRSAHLHPVRTPSGAIVTDEFPPDHLHQSGIFLAFTKTEFKGHDVDFWNLAGGKGRVRCKSVKGVSSGPVFGRILAEHEHVDLTAADATAGVGAKSGGDVALNETWEVQIWNVGMKSGYWLLDITSQITCASDQPLKLPEYHYGGMAIRAARSWTPNEVRFLTSEGDERVKGNQTRPRWCRVSGLVDGKPAGITLLTHPGNFRFPEPLRVHPTMPYMVYTPSFLGDWEIKPGTPHVSRYRFVVHDGELSAEILERLWQDYAQPLTASGT